MVAVVILPLPSPEIVKHETETSDVKNRVCIVK